MTPGPVQDSWQACPHMGLLPPLPSLLSVYRDERARLNCCVPCAVTTHTRRTCLRCQGLVCSTCEGSSCRELCKWSSMSRLCHTAACLPALLACCQWVLAHCWHRPLPGTVCATTNGEGGCFQVQRVHPACAASHAAAAATCCCLHDLPPLARWTTGQTAGSVSNRSVLALPLTALAPSTQHQLPAQSLLRVLCPAPAAAARNARALHF